MNRILPGLSAGDLLITVPPQGEPRKLFVACYSLENDALALRELDWDVAQALVPGRLEVLHPKPWVA